MSEPVTIHVGDVREGLAKIPAGSVQCCVTSPPYWGLRDYGVDGQIGLEESPDAYVAAMVEVFREVRRCLRDDGTLWLNLGDSYAAAPAGNFGPNMAAPADGGTYRANKPAMNYKGVGLKPKDLCMMPWRVALALQQPYTVPSIVKAEVDRAWLAAMFDGEGCIGVRRFNSYRKHLGQNYQDGFVVYTTITNNDVELLDRCIMVTGLGKARIKQRAGDTDGRSIVSRRDSYGWRLDGNGAVDVIRAIYPYLIAKKKQACIAYTLDTLNKNGHGSRSVPPEIQEKKRYLWELVKKCNQREKVDLPSWIVEPVAKVEPGWYLRSVIVWHKRSPMPESVTDRPTSSWEPIFLLAKQDRYFYDAEAVKEKSETTVFRKSKPTDEYAHGLTPSDVVGRPVQRGGKSLAYAYPNGIPFRNQRNVWTLSAEPYPEAHFATFPSEIPRRAIKAGTSEKGACPACGAPWTRVVEKWHENPGNRSTNGRKSATKDTGELGGCGYDVRLETRSKTTGWTPGCDCNAGEPVPCVVLDPFLGSGTTVATARELGRHGVGIELNPTYAELARVRIAKAERPHTYQNHVAAPAEGGLFA